MDIVDQLAPRGFDCVCGNLRMAARAVTSVYDRHLRDAGVSASQMSVLWAVAGTQGLAVKELAGRIAMDETTLIRNLRGLERQGWVALAVGGDRRRRLRLRSPMKAAPCSPARCRSGRRRSRRSARFSTTS